MYILIQENTYRNKKKTKNNDESNQSMEEERNSQLLYDQPFHANDNKQPYLPCRMPDGSHMKIKFIVKEEVKRKEKYEK